jgi:hypothetical protein
LKKVLFRPCQLKSPTGLHGQLRKTPSSKVRLVVTPQKLCKMVFSGLLRPLACLLSGEQKAPQ